MKLVRIITLWLLAPLAALADGDEVVVLYNTQVPASRTVADHYAAMRQVPTNQIFGFTLTTNEDMTRADFTDFLQKPLAAKLEESGLWTFGETRIPTAGNVLAHTEERVVKSRIRYAVLCYGMPLKIAADLDLAAKADKNAKPEFQRNEAAVDSELAWLPLIRMNVPLNGPLPNLLFNTTNRFMLSPLNGILMVSRLDGPSPEIANALVDKALAAEKTGLWGRAYFDMRNLQTNDAYYLGDAWLRAGAEMCRQTGFDVEVDTNEDTFPASFPMSQIAIYAGWYNATVNGPFALPKVEFMPGAFAYHLHSFSAETIRNPGWRWCGPLLARGATCTMGCVYEPYLQFTPNIAVFLRSWFNGFTFGEAAWAAQLALSWQTTVIGDPLYQPFTRTPLEQHAELARAKSPLIEWSFERLANLDLVHGAPKNDEAHFLENIPPTATSAVLTEKLADVYEEMDRPTAAIDAWQNALKLDPSPEQRIRIRLTLGEKLLERGLKMDAVENYKELLKEAPDYPGRPQIEEKLKTLEPNSTENKK